MPTVPVYPSIPVPSDEPGALLEAVQALKQTVEMLTGQDIGAAKFAPHVFVQPEVPEALHVGDLWLCTSVSYTFNVWDGFHWLKVGDIVTPIDPRTPTLPEPSPVHPQARGRRMMIFGSPDHARKIARAAGIGFDPDVDFVISRVCPQLLGGVIYTNYTGQSVQMHQAGFAPRWATKELLWAIYDFPFNYLKVARIIATVPSTNERAMKITQQMGFEYVTTIPGVVPGGDMEILSLLRHQCKYLKLKSQFSAGLMENAA